MEQWRDDPTEGNEGFLRAEKPAGDLDAAHEQTGIPALEVCHEAHRKVQVKARAKVRRQLVVVMPIQVR